MFLDCIDTIYISESEFESEIDCFQGLCFKCLHV